MTRTYDVIIIGGGVIGSSIAYQAAKQGATTAVVERKTAGCEASSAAAGILGAQAEIDEEGPLLEMAIKSRSMFPKLVEELKEATDMDVELIQRGLLKVAVTESEAEKFQKKITHHRRWDQNVNWLTEKEAREVEKGLSPHIFGAIHIPGDGQIEPVKLTKALIQAAVNLGVKLYEHCDVQSFIIENNEVTGVHTSNGPIYGKKVVVTTGAWAKQLMGAADVKVDAFPVKGECVSVQASRKLLTKTLFLDEGFYLVPKVGGRIIIGATKISHSFDKHVSLDGMSLLMEKAKHLLPDIAEASFEKAWAGLRPQTGDGLPYLGPHPEVRGLYAAFGHYRNGILLSAVTGQLLADALLKDDVSSPFFNAFRLTRKSISEEVLL